MTPQSLLEQISELEEKAKKDNVGYFYWEDWKSLKEPTLSLCTALRKAVEALEYYANEKHWQESGMGCSDPDCCDQGIETEKDKGELARRALKEIGA